MSEAQKNEGDVLHTGFSLGRLHMGGDKCRGTKC